MPRHLTTSDAGGFVTIDRIGQPNGVAGLDSAGLIPSANLPPVASGVASVNGRVGYVLLDADAVGAVSTGAVNTPLGVAPLDSTGKLPVGNLPVVAVQSVNGYNGPSVTLASADVGAIPTTQKGAASGVASLGADGRVPSAQLAPTGTFNVLEAPYSAVGNGVADDTAAIQAALDAAHTAGGGVVILPSGHTYATTTYLTAYDNTTVRAHGATVITKAQSGLLRNYWPGESFTEYNGHSNITIEGGTWDANAANSGSGVVTVINNAFLLSHGKNITIKDLTAKNVSGGHGVDIGACDTVRVLNCRFEGFKDNTSDASRGFSEAIQVDFAISGSGGSAVTDGTPTKNVLVQGCSFGASSRLPGFGRAVGSHTSYNATTWAQNIRIIGNNIESTAQEGIRIYAWKNAVVADNNITGTGLAGIIVTGPDPAVAGYNLACDAVVIQGNTVSAATSSSPIRVVGFSAIRPTNVIIDGNVVLNSTSTGIYVSQATSPVISNNTVSTSTTSSIYVITCSDPHVVGNRCLSATSSSLGIDTCTGGHVETNSIVGGSSHGIFVSGGSNISVVGNRVSGVSGSGIRATSSTSRPRILNNVILRGGVMALGIDVTASATNALVISNDLTGGSWPAGTALSLLGAAPLIVDWNGGTTSPGMNLVN